MRTYDIIEKKKAGGELTDEEIKFIIDGYTAGKIPDYQISALLMAIYFRGMTERECASLTHTIAYSGKTVSPDALGARSCDKHSSGGVGDKTTLIVAPLAAALGLTVAKMSGRGLGHTGGTVDKLEAFPGYKTVMGEDEFISQAKDIGVCVIGQSEGMTPADKLLYALRDVTATVDSIPLIAASIMSKKIAAGSRCITLDVKCGSGAFMTDKESACELASLMVRIGTALGRRVSALITDMDFPLGRCVGNTLEIKEAYEILSGGGDARLRELCTELCADMAQAALGGEREGHLMRARQHLDDGTAMAKFTEWLTRQGVDEKFAKSPELLPSAPIVREVRAKRSGFVSGCNARLVGQAAMALGAGRATKDDAIDLTAGIELLIDRASFVEEGATIARLHTSDGSRLDAAEALIHEAYTVSTEPPKAVPIVLARISSAANR